MTKKRVCRLRASFGTISFTKLTLNITLVLYTGLAPAGALDLMYRPPLRGGAAARIASCAIDISNARILFFKRRAVKETHPLQLKLA